MSDPIEIRRAATPAEYKACQVAQRKAWGITEDGYVVPVATMVGAQLHGGIVLGAFLPNGEAVGLSFAFLGRVEGRIGLYSQLTGVIPGYQDQGIGSRLKSKQREIAASEGVELIAWAFDPLQAGNARFNLDKLGATSGQYVENMYGLRSDALNTGTPTDRLIVAWETHDDRLDRAAPLAGPGGARLIHVERQPNGDRAPSGVIPPPDTDTVLIEIPLDIKTLRAQNPGLAEAWQLGVRKAFQSAFALGFRAVGFERSEFDGESVGYYRLVRRTAVDPMQLKTSSSA